MTQNFNGKATAPKRKGNCDENLNRYFNNKNNNITGVYKYP